MDEIFLIIRKKNELITISSTKFVIGCFQLLSLGKILLYEQKPAFGSTFTCQRFTKL